MNQQEDDCLNNSSCNNNAVNNELGRQEWDNFGEIPELPTGQTLRFELLSPWDDPTYIGLGRIEIFNSQGERPSIINTFTNSLENYGNLFNLFGEERQQQRPSTSPLINKTSKNINRNEVVNNSEYLLNRNNNTQWLCNYRVLPSVEPIHIGAHFRGAQTLAMIRIRNYSGSRIHALRGVRNLRIWLDNFCIFYGEICCAVGNSTTGDTILFTTNEEILAKIAEHDEQILQIPEQQQHDSLGDSNQHNLSVLAALQQAGFAAAGRMEPLVQSNELPCVTAAHFRPTTGGYNNNIAPTSASPPRQVPPVSDGECSLSLQNNLNSDLNQKEKDKGEEEESEENKNQEEEILEDDSCVGKLFHMELVESWGSADSIGLTGVQFLGPGFAPIDDNLAKECVVRCEPVVVVNEERQPAKTGDLNNLLNGINLTCDPKNMWIMNKEISEDDLLKQSSIFLSFTFPREVRISGISIWNYNASTELSYAGVRYARFYANGRPINGLGDILLRRAPGFVFFDFVQDVLFDRCTLQRPLSCARPQTRSVAAFIFQLRLLSTWGDEFYIGLNGIELFNRQDKLIRLHPQNLAAFPESVNCLTSVKDDPRTSDKLIDGCNDTNKPYHMWLTPILPNSCARIFVIFDAPTYVTRIRIYNYRKTSARGVRHIAVRISADDLLLCSGAEVPASSAEATGILDIPLRDFEGE